jgi:hypothetical protein
MASERARKQRPAVIEEHPEVAEAMHWIERHENNTMAQVAEQHQAIACRITCYPDTKVEPLVGIAHNISSISRHEEMRWWWCEFALRRCDSEGDVIEAISVALSNSHETPDFAVQAVILWAGQRRWYARFANGSPWSLKFCKRKPDFVQVIALPQQLR